MSSKVLGSFPIIAAALIAAVASLDGLAAVELPWLVILASFAVYETRTIVNKAEGDTFSEMLRTWFRTKSTTGKVTFATIWVTFAAWMLIHIIQG